MPVLLINKTKFQTTQWGEYAANLIISCNRLQKENTLFTNFSKMCMFTQWDVHPGQCLWWRAYAEKEIITISISFCLEKVH